MNDTQLGQLIRTSCLKGLGAGPGIQVQAMSDNVSESQRAELESVKGYAIPSFRSIYPDSPSDDQIKQLCPPEYRHTYFNNSSHAITRLVYGGADYSGRDGNYIAHSLVTSTTGDLYPIDFIQWSNWISVVSEEPPSLLSVPKDDFKVDKFTLQNLSRFISSNPTRLLHFPEMLQAVVLRKKDNRPVIVRDKIDNLAYWIACLTKAFPRNIRCPIQFSTYSNTLISGVDIQGTTEFSEFELGPDVFARKAYVFDFIDDAHSDIEMEPVNYCHALSQQMSGDEPSESLFNAYVEKISIPMDIADLSKFHSCYESIVNGKQHISVSGIKTAFELVAISDENQFDFVQKLVELLEVNSETQTDFDRLAVAKSIELQADQLQIKSRNELVILLNQMLLHDLQYTANQSAEILSSLSSIESNPHVFTKNDVDDLCYLVEKKIQSKEAMDGIYQTVITRVNTEDYGNGILHPVVLSITKYAAVNGGYNQALCALLPLAADYSADRICDVVVELSRKSYSENSSIEVAKELTALLDKKTKHEASAIRQLLAKKRLSRVLLAELTLRKLSSSLPLEAYLKELGMIIPILDEQSGHSIFPELNMTWKASDRNAQLKIAQWIIQQPAFYKNSKHELVTEAIECLCKIIPIDPRSEKNNRLALSVEQFCTGSELTKPNVLIIRTFIRALCDCKGLREAMEIQFPHPLTVLDANKNSVVNCILEIMMPRCADACDHWQLIEWCNTIVGDEETVAESYSAYLSSKSMRNISLSGSRAYALASVGICDEECPNESISRIAEDKLNPWLRSISKKQFSAVCDSVNKGCEFDIEIQSGWVERCEAIRMSRRTLLSKAAQSVAQRFKLRGNKNG